MKLKKLPGFSLGLIALAVGNAYAEQFIQHDEYKHAGNDSNLLIVFYVQIMPDDFVMQLHRF